MIPEIKFGFATAHAQLVRGYIPCDERRGQIIPHIDSDWDEIHNNKLIHNGNFPYELTPDHMQGWLTHPELFHKHLIEMKKMGVQILRVGGGPGLVTQDGQINKEKMDPFLQMLKEIKDKGIDICYQINHTEVPLWVAGWHDPKIIPWFKNYVSLVVPEVLPYASMFVTLNEPTVQLGLGFLKKHFPPFRKNDYPNAVIIGPRNMAAVHNFAYDFIKELDPKMVVGIVHQFANIEPADPRSLRDKKATDLCDWLFNVYPMTVMKPEKTDFIFANIYQDLRVRYRFSLAVKDAISVGAIYDRDGGVNWGYFLNGTDVKSDLDWNISPAGFEKVLKRLWNTYGKPIFIAENGLPEINEERYGARSMMLIGNMLVIEELRSKGVDIRGYLHWTLSDHSLEWNMGAVPFGVLDVNNNWKRSAHILAEIYNHGYLTHNAVRYLKDDEYQKLMGLLISDESGKHLRELWGE